MKIQIQDYRGFEISFDTEKELFYVYSDSYDNEGTNKSFASAKKYIDDYIKNNAAFKGFRVVPNPVNGWKSNEVFITGITKAGKFSGEEKGKKVTISVYDETSYIILQPENEPILYEIQKAEERIAEIESSIKQLKTKINIVTLKDIKKNYVTEAV